MYDDESLEYSAEIGEDFAELSFGDDSDDEGLMD